MLGFFSRNKKQKVHFLHVGKTGGTAVKFVLRNYPETPKYSLVLHGHGRSLKGVPRGEYVIFFLRDPISRFISGFYSRQRKGRPRHNVEWNHIEKEVFEHFTTPNQLALSLANKKASDHELAVTAMKNIKHFRPYNKWYLDFKYFQSRIDDILFIGFQESLDTDFIRLKKILNISQEISLPTDDIAAHRNPKNLDKSIDEKGILALNDWYADDFKFISLCKEIISNKAKVSGDL